MSEEEIPEHIQLDFSEGLMWIAVVIVGVAFAVATGLAMGCRQPTVVCCNID